MKRILFAAAVVLFMVGCNGLQTTAPTSSNGIVPVDPLVQAGIASSAQVSKPDWLFSNCATNCLAQAFHAQDPNGVPVHGATVYALWNNGANLAGGKTDANGNVTLNIPAGSSTIWLLANAYYFNTSPFTIFNLYNNPTQPVVEPVIVFTMTVCC